MTIYEKLKESLGREPTNLELKNEVKRIIESVPSKIIKKVRARNVTH